MTKKQKLELTWVGKENRPRLEPRVLVEAPELSHYAKARVSENDIFDNILIQGDNLLALKALEAEYAGKVKCVFIDPPYNTGSAFTHYDDGLEHSIWLGLMRDRLEIIRRLLAEDGSLWVTLDDNEAHYFKVLCDEIFGRTNFVGSSIWQHSVQAKGYSGKFSIGHNYVFTYRKSEKFVLKDLPRTDEHNVNYRNPDNDPRGPWRAGDVRNALVRKNLMYNIRTPSGKTIRHPPKGWRFSRETFERELAENKIMFSADETRIIRKIYLSDQEGRVPETIWHSTEVGTTREANAEVRALLDNDLFDTPKPERLIGRVLDLATYPGDLVLDSFAGSGTTGAVAHKMGRRWIMVELGEHAHTHIVPRLNKVIDGEDLGGVTKSTGWTGGGGYRFFRLAPSLMEKDRWGREVISKAYNAAMLAEALCKLEGFTYTPNPEVWWQHGRSTDSDFLYVTTQTLGPRELAMLSEEVGDDRTLLVLCSAWSGNADAFQNLTLRKIPNHVRDKCEWGKDDYSLNVANLPMAEASPKALAPDDADEPPPRRGRQPKARGPQPGLFDADAAGLPEDEA
jgi:adenine-specific DNA-methyltransferase